MQIANETYQVSEQGILLGQDGKVTVAKYLVKLGPKNIFVCPEGWLFTGLDYSSQELMIGAVWSGDPKMLQAYIEPEKVSHPETGEQINNPLADLHTITTKEACFPAIFKGKDWYEWIPTAKSKGLIQFPHEPRHYGKITNFTLIYGGTALSLSVTLALPEKLCTDIIKGHKKTYATYHNWAAENAAIGAATGWISTPWGHRVRAVNETNAKGGGSAELMAVNVAIQGTGADICKEAMNRIWRWKEKYNYPVRLVGQVHDEVVPIIQGSAKLDLDKCKWEGDVIVTPKWKVEGPILDLAPQVRQIMIDVETECFDGRLEGRVDYPDPSPFWKK